MVRQFFKLGLGVKLKHANAPPKLPWIKRAVLIVGDPFEVLPSIFRHKAEVHGRAWPRKHCKNLGGDYQSMGSEWSLLDYLNNGVDLFGFEAQFFNWSRKQGVDYPVMILKYEAMWDHLPELFRFVGEPLGRISEFPAQLKRTSYFETLSAQEQAGLARVYGGLRRAMQSLGEVSVQ